MDYCPSQDHCLQTPNHIPIHKAYEGNFYHHNYVHDINVFTTNCNSLQDVKSYMNVGIPESRIFTVNHKVHSVSGYRIHWHLNFCDTLSDSGSYQVWTHTDVSFKVFVEHSGCMQLVNYTLQKKAEAYIYVFNLFKFLKGSLHMHSQGMKFWWVALSQGFSILPCLC